MSSLKTTDMLLVVDLFQREGAPGFVLDFSDRTFSEFFQRELGVNIDTPQFSQRGRSKLNRLRFYLSNADDLAAAKALQELWEYRLAVRARDRVPETVPEAEQRIASLIRRLGGNFAAKDTPRPEAPKLVSEEISRQLTTQLLAISQLDSQPPGYAFERFLKSLFDAHDLLISSCSGCSGSRTHSRKWANPGGPPMSSGGAR